MDSENEENDSLALLLEEAQDSNETSQGIQFKLYPISYLLFHLLYFRLNHAFQNEKTENVIC